MTMPQNIVEWAQAFIISFVVYTIIKIWWAVMVSAWKSDFVIGIGKGFINMWNRFWSLFPLVSQRYHDEQVLLISKTLTQNYDAVIEKERKRIDELIESLTKYKSLEEFSGLGISKVSVTLDRKLLVAFYHSVYNLEDQIMGANIIGERVKRQLVERLLEVAREIRMSKPVTGDTAKDLYEAMVIGEYYVPAKGSSSSYTVYEDEIAKVFWG